MSRIALAALLVLTACASEEQLQERWDAYVAEHASCEVPDDCALVYPGCPLGCFDAVNADAADEAEAYAEALIGRYERGGRRCDYGCMAPSEPTCDAGVCTVTALE